MLNVAIGSVGTVGEAVARRLDKGVSGLRLVAVSANNREAAEQRLSNLTQPVAVLPLDELAERADVIVECAPAAVFPQIAQSAIANGRTFVPISVGALLSNWQLVDEAANRGARIRVPSGAILGLDAIRAAAEGEINSVTMVTRKPPAGLKGAPHLVNNNINIDAIDEPVRVFAGSAREGAVGFPANVNVAAAVALAGLGADQTRLEVWADPSIDRNTHTVTVDADSARFEVHMQSIPTEQNPATGRIVAQSVVSTLRSLVDPLVVGG